MRKHFERYRTEESDLEQTLAVTRSVFNQRQKSQIIQLQHSNLISKQNKRKNLEQ